MTFEYGLAGVAALAGAATPRASCSPVASCSNLTPLGPRTHCHRAEAEPSALGSIRKKMLTSGLPAVLDDLDETGTLRATIRAGPSPQLMTAVDEQLAGQAIGAVFLVPGAAVTALTWL